ncbi:hypothetical protein FIU93_21350 [Labrenzia sp. THAF35]|uniref:GntR family transcriptional regulator n=1 Tax=Labrenzia sp. THAF35 TaxID=2587854 RepID=UPI001267D0D8|nr:GntR family transcriptional regulator [Labrenzia sp. THAF35]QFT69347.1 hypothetical protein FIU93_21350 [Labrenzia sp. THAF35]
MSEAKRDTQRALKAAQEILDGRGMDDAAAVMVTLEHAVATLLMALYRDHAFAASMLNESLVPGIEARIARTRTSSNSACWRLAEQ